MAGEVIIRKRTYSVSEFVKEIGISMTQTYRLIERGEIPVIRLGHRLFIPSWYVEQLLGEPHTEFTPGA